MKCGFRKELVALAVALPLAFVAAGCSNPDAQEPATSTALNTTANAAPAPDPAPPPAPVPADSAPTTPEPVEPEEEEEEEEDTEPARPASSARTTADGVYTMAQANRGHSNFQTFCTACHNATDFQGSNFEHSWGSRTVGDIHEFVSEMMPMDAPGSLTAEQYAEIIAFFLSQNGYPAGQTELPSSNAALKQIKFAQGSSGD